MERKIAHLQMIQSAIDRMANSEFLIRGWTVTLVAGIFALSAKDSDKSFLYIAYLPVVLFWILDAYYLSLERCFRSLYDVQRKKEVDEVTFEMKCKVNFCEWMKSFFAIPILLFYPVLLGIILFVMSIRN